MTITEDAAQSDERTKTGGGGGSGKWVETERPTRVKDLQFILFSTEITSGALSGEFSLISPCWHPASLRQGCQWSPQMLVPRVCVFDEALCGVNCYRFVFSFIRGFVWQLPALSWCQQRGSTHWCWPRSHSSSETRNGNMMSNVTQAARHATSPLPNEAVE